MESGSSSTGKKKHDTEEDLLHNKLSEVEPQLISHILSFLPTTDAFRTSVLSKKWLNNWTFITKLDFDDGLYDGEYSCRTCTHCEDDCPSVSYVCDKVGYAGLALCQSCSVSQDALYNGGNSLSFPDLREERFDHQKFEKYFVNFVYKALLFTNNSSNSRMLDKFSLVIYNRHDVADLNIWISSVLNRGVKNLMIYSSVYELPFSASTSNYLLNSTLLEELKLELKMFTTIKVPTNSVHFGHLNHLKLSGIYFDIDPSSNCLTLKLPVLKMFEIRDCNWSSGKDVIVEAPLLESILIHDYLEDLQCQSIKFNVLYLKEFSYRGYVVSQQIDLSGCGFLSFASVKIYLYQCRNIHPETTCYAFELFQHFHQVKCIKLKGSEVLTQSEVVHSISALPELANLSHLELGLVTIEVILGLLQRSPVLKTLILKKLPKFAKEVLNLAVVPECLTSTLQIVNFEKVDGDEQELLFLAEFFLEKGKMLERMSFFFDNTRLAKSKAVKEFKEKVYSFNKGPSFGYLEFSFD